MKKYITVAALLAAGTAFANAAELVAHYGFDGEYTDACGKNSFANTDALTYADSDLDGLGQYLEVKDNKALWNGTTEGFTQDIAVSMLIKASELPVGNNAEHQDWTAQWIWGGGALNTGGAKLGIGIDGQLKFSLHNNGDASLDSEAVIQVNEWCQIGFSVLGGTLTLWLNGKAVATKSNYTHDLDWGKVSLVEGKDACGKRFVGGLDEVQVWALESTDDVATLMKGAASVIPEPSAFGLLAGIGALALVASRRRKRA